jgi:AmiR/NasT family two-component response regulator
MASQLTNGHGPRVEAIASEREERLAELVVALADENANLQRALDTRVVIEQAKGVLAERFGLDVHDAFDLLRLAARSNRMRLRDLATRVVQSRQTPPEIEATRLGRGLATRS